MPRLDSLIGFLLVLFVAALAVIWWARRHNRGLDWVIAAIPLAFAASYLSSLLFRVPDYQAACDGFCPGWLGHPIATHISDGVGAPVFNAGGFVANAVVYYAAILIFSGLVVRLAGWLSWPERRRRWKVGFVLLAILVPLALTPLWLPPPEPTLSGPEQRLAINAARAWRRQLQFRRLSDRRLALEDVQLHPDGERYRACFRTYTWFYLSKDKVYIDLEPAGVRATGGGVISLDDSCWVQP